MIGINSNNTLKCSNKNINVYKNNNLTPILLFCSRMRNKSTKIKAMYVYTSIIKIKINFNFNNINII